MEKLKEYYRLFDMFKGKLNDDQKKILEGLEDQLIAEEILPAISESVAHDLGTLRRPLTLVVDYDPEGGITVKTTRGEVVVKEHTAKKYEIPNTKKVVKVSEVEDTTESPKPEIPEIDAPIYACGPIKKFEVRLNGEVVEDTTGTRIFTETIRRIGYEQVAALNITFIRGTYNLVDKNRRPDNGVPWQRQSDGWYIYTNFDNPHKAEILAEIAKRLDINMQITLDGKKFYPKD